MEENAVRVKVVPTRVMFENAETDYRIYACKPVGESKKLLSTHPIFGSLTIKGVVDQLTLDSEYEFVLLDESTDQYPASYKIQEMIYELPKDTAGQRAFLSAIITEKQLESIYDYYDNDEDVLEMIVDGSFDTKKVKGIGEKTLESIKMKIERYSNMSSLISFLAPYSISMGLINKIYDYYKSDVKVALKQLSENPYELVKIKGIGFKKADEIGLELGISPTDTNRIASSFSYVIEDVCFSNGDTWIEADDLIKEATKLLGINKKYVRQEFETERHLDYGIINYEGKLSMKYAFMEELHVFDFLEKAKKDPTELFTKDEIDQFINNYEKENETEFTHEQKHFLHTWNKYNVSFLIGYAGTGKTFLQSILLKMLESKGLSYLLLAPTGKASKVMENYSKRPASTIHRAIGLQGDRKDVELRPIKEDVVLIDESSMADISLISNLMFAIELGNPKAKVIFIGDDYQLPSVGIGNFLYDCIHHYGDTVSRLTKVFRQDEGGILDVATKIREGVPFIERGAKGRTVLGEDCVVDIVNQASIRDATYYYYEKLINQGFSAEDIMVLSTRKNGIVGTMDINAELEEVANPDDNKTLDIKMNENLTLSYKVGDLVMNIANSYDRDQYKLDMLDNYGAIDTKANVFNGDTGTIVEVDLKSKSIYIDFDNIIFKFKHTEVKKQIIHSYAITIHKSQGSASKVVILILDKSSTFQLNANLIYTGVTRTIDYLLILGQEETINRACKKFQNMKRKSFLGILLEDSKNV